MPYIDPKHRIFFKGVLDALKQVDDKINLNAGDLNYLFSNICALYLKENLKYQGINDCIGELEGTKLELYRRIAAPYEDKKIKENGDI
jgi:hypothetical protein